MGRGDNRRTPKMKRIRGKKKRKARDRTVRQEKFEKRKNPSAASSS
ncbi:MAG: hypothetical protein QF752_12955 [Planctomycetota bacterium]|nr:hypothetical protein [Planctomycetota bacterium]